MSDYTEGTLGVWSTYYDQADPLVIYRDGGWDNLTIDSLRELLTSKTAAHNPCADCPGCDKATCGCTSCQGRCAL